MPKRAKPRRAQLGGSLDRTWRERIIPAVLRRDMGICHACRAMGCQATGADSADHDPVPRSECEARGINVYDMSNLKAIHHKACPWCGVKCNQIKFNGTMAAFKLKWERASGQRATTTSTSSGPEGREF